MFKQEIYAGYLKSVEREYGSSGGIFYQIAKYVISKGGIVCGVEYDENLMVRHVLVDKEEDILRLCGSKYVQSNIGKVVSEIADKVKETHILFAGTPCQVAAVKGIIKNKNLITMDFACHGVVSEKIWKIGLEQLRDENGLEKIVKVNMRSKKSGWSNYGFSWEIMDENNKSCLIPQNKVVYMNGFVNDIYLRPSCYNCRFKGFDRKSDITLGDFWGIWDTMPGMDDNKGTSIIMINSEKGREVFNEISSDIHYMKVDSEDKALIENAGLMKQAKFDIRRKAFFELIDKGKDYKKLVNRLIGFSYFDRGINKIKKTIIKEKDGELINYKDRINIIEQSVKKNKSDCSGCSICKYVCNSNAITMECDTEGYFYPKIDSDKCVDCKLCYKSCPIE